MRTRFGILERLGDQVVDLILILDHPFQVLVQCNVFDCAVFPCRCIAQQLAQRRSVGEVLPRAFFQDFAELVPKRLVLIRLFVRHRLECRQDSFGQRVANARHAFVFLQGFSRDVERQVVGIDDAFDETQVHRQELIGFIHDEDALYV